MPKKTEIDHYSDKEALDFHIKGKSGKIEIGSSKPLTTKRDLSLAYSPGVAAPVKEISKDPELAYDYTSKGNLVAVISNGSAILGLGNLGSLASKPVMEGKSVLFKRFADIDSIDIEIDTNDTEEIIKSIKNISKSFGGINLEDIKAPECFVIEKKLKFYYVLIDHQIRKKSTEEAYKVKILLKKHNIPLIILTNSYMIKKNIQSEARKIRYQLLLNFCNKKKAKTILTAHNLEDQVETFFIRLSRL